MNRTIVFKNGNELEVKQEIVDYLVMNFSENENRFSVFQNDEGLKYLVINVLDISHIV